MVIVSGQAAAIAAIRDEVQAPLEALGDGVWRVAGDPRSRWGERPPIFVRHAMAVDVEVALTGAAADVVAVVDAGAAALAGRVDVAQSLSVQTRILTDVGYRPFDVNAALSARLGAPVDVRRPAQIVSVVIAGGPPTAYVGLGTAQANLSDWAGGMRRLARDDAQVSRAEGKLVEALEVFGLEVPRGGVAVDLGAAPGGWTRVLQARGARVHAVDPAALDARVAALPGVTWHAMTAERWLATAPATFDVLVCDMKMDARDVARLLGPLARRVTGWGVVTLKLPGHDQRKTALQALDLLARDWRIGGARQLFHNRSEVTVLVAPDPGGARAPTA